MPRLFTLPMFLVTTSVLSACGSASEEPGDSAVLSQAQKVVFLSESPTTLTLYSEPGLWGSALTIRTTPASSAEFLRLITKPQVEAAGLLGHISSLRLTCGSRAAHVMLYDSYNTGGNETTGDFAAWSEFGTGRFVSCTAGQSVAVDLHQQLPELADRVASIYFMTHARHTTEAGFSAFVKSNWSAGLANLPSGAAADGEPQLKLLSSESFKLRQNLKLDDWRCGARGAHFVLNAMLSAERKFSVTVSEEYVDTGWGDAWGCRDGMKKKLHAGAVDAANRLAPGLDKLSAQVGAHARSYLVPFFNLSEFDLFGGGDAAVGVPSPSLGGDVNTLAP